MKPEKTIRAGAISVTIWRNDTSKGSYTTLQVQRSYKDSDGCWKHSGTLRVSDIPKAVLVLNKAFEYVSIDDEAAT